MAGGHEPPWMADLAVRVIRSGACFYAGYQGFQALGDDTADRPFFTIGCLLLMGVVPYDAVVFALRRVMGNGNGKSGGS